MTRPEPDTEELLDRVAAGDGHARQALLGRHRFRLRRMVAAHLDRRLAARLDPSDVVQEALLEADRGLDAYARERPVSFYPWLRQIAWDRLIEEHRRHVGARKRSVLREVSLEPRLPGDSVLDLAGRLCASGTSPSHQAVKKELRERVRRALVRLPQADREVLVLRHTEQLSAREMAEVLRVGESAAKMRYLRALERLRALLEEPTEEES